jgi:hypothetical protein
MMIQYESDDDYADFPSEISEVESKRKRLRQDDHYALEENPQRGLTSEGIVEVTAWAFVGGIGLVLAIGSAMVAMIAPNGDPGVMVVPLVYMIAAMYFMRRRH